MDVPGRMLIRARATSVVRRGVHSQILLAKAGFAAPTIVLSFLAWEQHAPSAVLQKTPRKVAMKLDLQLVGPLAYAAATKDKGSNRCREMLPSGRANRWN